MQRYYTPTASREERIETGNGLANKIRDSIQHWQERLALENPHLVERYKEGKLHVLLKFSAGVIPKEYVIVFHGESHITDKEIPRIHGRSLWEHFWIKHLEVDSQIASGNSDWEPMLIDDAQAVQAPENIPLASFIWLDSAYRIYSVLPHSLYLSKSLGFILCGTRARKLNALTFAAICSTPESACKVVQTRSEVLDSVSGNDENFGRDRLYVRDAIRRASLCIHLADRFVWPTIQESGGLDFQILDVMVGPFDLDAD
jgi:hypothetical protein